MDVDDGFKITNNKNDTKDSSTRPYDRGRSFREDDSTNEEVETATKAKVESEKNTTS